MTTVNHAISQKDLPLRIQVLNISVNLSRISQWIFEGYNTKRPLINKLIEQTDRYLNDLSNQSVSQEFSPTLVRFRKEFKDIKEKVTDEENKLYWAEKALTWANILQHRAELA